MSSNNSKGEETKISYLKDDFFQWLETIQYIENDSNSIQDIVSVLSSALGDKWVRAIIRKGIMLHSKDMENENIIPNIHKELESSQLTSKCSENKGGNDEKLLHNQVFRISDVACHIFKYLDTESTIRCKNVNLLWLYNASNPASYYHLNIYDLICYKYESFSRYEYHQYINKQMFVRCEKELNKLINKSNGSIRSITLCEWPQTNRTLFSSMVDKLTRLESIEIVDHEEETLYNCEERVFDGFFDENYPRVVLDLLSNNRESIKSIAINVGDCCMSPPGIEIFQKMNTLLFPKLSSMIIYCPSSNILPIDISQPLWMNHCNLKMICFKNVQFPQDFFQKLTTNDVLLHNIETFILHGSEVNFDKIFQSLIKKMTNIEHLDFSCNISLNQWISMLIKLPQASTIKSLTLKHNKPGFEYRDSKAHQPRWTATGDDGNVYYFKGLQSLTVKTDDVLEVKPLLESVSKCELNGTSNIKQLTVECSANSLVSDVLSIKHHPLEHNVYRKPFLSKLKFVKCESIREQIFGEIESTNDMLQAMKNISQWLDTRERHNCAIKAFDLGSFNYCDEFFKDYNYEGCKKLSKLARTFLDESLSLNKNDNVDCTWRVGNNDEKRNLGGSIVEQMKQLSMVSSTQVKHYTIALWYQPDIKFECYSLFNQRMCFEQDDRFFKVVLKSKYTQ